MTDTDLFPVDDGHLAALRAALVGRAQSEDLLDIAYRTVDSPVGTLLLATTDAGLVRVAYEREGFDDVLDALAEKVSPRILSAPARLDTAARQLDQYFARTRREFDLPLNFAMSAGFRKTVQHYLPHIAYGRTASYRDVAEGVGNPKAVRAVGTACATNPLPVVVPCHRVLRSDGSLGGYVGGTTAKTTLLDLERAA
jgi:methylated-DNA-[protein]-cysteine S-methyltransferase